MKKILLFAIMLMMMWGNADAGYKNIAVIVDSTAHYHQPAAIPADSAAFDSTGIIFQMLAWTKYDVDTIYLATFDVAGVNIPYATSRAAFLDSINDYQLVINAQEKVGIWGDTASGNSAGSGLQYYHIQAIYDYVYNGGAFINLDHHLSTPYLADTALYDDKIWGLTIGAAATESLLIVFGGIGNNNIYHPYFNVSGTTKDTVPVAATNHFFGYYPVTAIGNTNVDTLIMVEPGTDRPYLLFTEYGLGGMCAQILGSYRWLYPKYTGLTSNTYGAGLGLDYLIFGLVEFMMSRHSVSANMEFGPFVAGQIDDMPSGSYADITGEWFKIGMAIRQSLYLYELNAADSTELQALHLSNLLSYSYQARDTDSGLFVRDPLNDPTTQLSVADWGEMADSMRWSEDTTGSGDYKGYYIGLIADPTLLATAHIWGMGTNDCIIESLATWGVNITNNYLSPIADRVAKARFHGLPYYSQHIVNDWMRDSLDDNTQFIDTLWHIYYRPDTSWGDRGAPDWMAHGVDNMTNNCPCATIADTLIELASALTLNINRPQIAKFPILFYVHGTGKATYNGVRSGIYALLESMFQDSIKAHTELIFTTERYNEMLGAHRDSVTLNSYEANRYSVSFTLVHNTAGNSMPVKLTYTVRRNINNVIYKDVVFLPSDWDSAINVYSQFDPDDKTWYHSPGYSANSHHIMADEFGTDGWF